MNILFLGDIVGRIGRQAVAKLLPGLRKKHNIDLTIANGENASHGSGLTESTVKELMEAGIDVITTGDHIFKRRNRFEFIDKYPILRPENYSSHCPGIGYKTIETPKGAVLVINLIGRVYMPLDHNCPFQALTEILAKISLPNIALSAIIVDIHAETTSEKVNMWFHADGRVTAVLGTHTHVQTADARVSPKGTGFITDAGMTGVADESIGIAHEGTLKTFLTQIKEQHVIPEKGRAQLNGVIVKTIPGTISCSGIYPLAEYVNIK